MSRFIVERYRKMRAAVDIRPHLVATPDNDNGAPDCLFGENASATIWYFVEKA